MRSGSIQRFRAAFARNVGSFCNMEIKNPELASRLVEIRKMIDDEISSDMPVLV